MSVLKIAADEWARLFLSKRGWLSILTFALIWAVFLFYVILPAARFIASPEASLVVGILAGQIGMSTLSQWQSVQIAFYWGFALYLLPFFTMFTAADQIASDKAIGHLRFLVLRASRSEIFFGRFLGQFGIQLLMIVATLASVLLVVAINSPDNLSASFQESPIVVLNLALVLLPYVALMALVSVLAKSARQATLFAIVGWIILWILIGYIQSRFGPFGLLDWVLPGSQLSSLLRLYGSDTFSLLPIPVIHTVILLALGWLAIQRADL